MEDKLNRNIRRLHHFLNDQLLQYEQEENYELCSTVLGYQNQLSDYLLGYITYEKVFDLVYDLVKLNGTLLSIDIYLDCYWASFELMGVKWEFEVDSEEFQHLGKLHEAMMKNITEKK